MLYLFDVDDTIISSYMRNSDRAYHTWHALPGRCEHVRALIMAGDRVALVSNQGGVAFSKVTEFDVKTKMVLVAGLLGYTTVCLYDGSRTPHVIASLEPPTLNIHVAYGDPRSPLVQYRDELRRKPNPTMLLEAMRVLQSAAAQGVLMIGDRDEDEQAARAAGVPFMSADEFFRGV